MNRLRVLVGLMALLLGAGCATRKESPAGYLDRIDADHRAAAQAFQEGKLSGRDYLALSIDRAGKARRFRQDEAWRAAALKGDQDEDGVPDSYDRCIATPRMQPTDERGCTLPERTACAENDIRCGPTPEQDRHARGLAQQTFLMTNPRCGASPIPQTPEPLQWGRGEQPSLNSAGFNLVVTQVANQTPECEYFYEVEAYFHDATNPAEAGFGRALFKYSEDLRPADARRAVFGLPANTELPPGRSSLRAVFEHAADIQWRVRAVNGAQKTSPWSEFRLHGPASSGVPGRDL